MRLQVVARAFLVMRMMQTLREVEMEAKEVGGKVAHEMEALSWDTKAPMAVRRHSGGCCCGMMQCVTCRMR